MEFKRFLNMYQIPLTVFWLSIIHTSVTYGVIGNTGFPYDLMAESSDNVASKRTDKTKVDDEKRTLSQQVMEGKYGLIHKELFSKPVTRPGIISYSNNNEVPNDTASNLGGLNKSDIWLAENHLLVIKGGFYPLLETLPEYTNPIWSPIDDFDAPKRQVKIPKNPKVPPPFPVQLTDGGPLQILGSNYTRNINDTFFSPSYPLPPMEGYEPGSGPFYPPTYPYPPDIAPGKTPFPAPPNPSSIPDDKDRSPLNTGGSILPPFFDTIPPGSAILPAPNVTDQNDEDDLSIYYPPPYSFYYPTDNSTKVPPGPLVPGIVLPPPPDFFGVLQTPTTTTTTTTPRPTTTTKLPQRTKPVSVTILRPVKTKPPTIYVYDNHIPHKPFAEYGPPPRTKVSITTTKIPLRAYFSTSPKTDFIKPKRPEKQYYYYDSNNPETNSISAQFPLLTKAHYVNNSNNYLVKPQYYYIPRPANNFKAHIVELEEQIHSYDKPSSHFQTNRYKAPGPKPVYQYSFEVSNYHEQHNKLQDNSRPTYSVQIEPAIEITTPPPQTYYNYHTTTNSNHNVYQATSNPLYKTHYTKQEERVYDDMTKTYFTTFGKRIKPTTPLPPVQQYTITKPRVNIESIKAINVQNQRYQVRPNIETIISGKPQTQVETLRAVNIPSQSFEAPTIQNNYQHIQQTNGESLQYTRVKQINSFTPTQIHQLPNVQTIKAINQQYIPVRQQKTNIINPYIETIDAISIPSNVNRQRNVFNPYLHRTNQQSVQAIQAIRVEPNTKPGSFISYQLPGDDGAHFYFLTPQLAQNGERQHIAYYYPQPGASRLRRSS